MKIGIKHAAGRETFDDAQFLNPKQDQGRPDVVEKLNGDEQHPKWNLVSFGSARKSNAIMPNEHGCLIVGAFAPNAFFGA